LPRHVYETYIRTTPERLWQALVDPELTRRYFYRCDFSGELSPGSAYTYTGPGGEVAVDGTIEEAEPFRRLVMTFHIAFDEEAARERPSRVTWEITPLGEVCRLTLVHQDLHGAPRTRQITATGWPPLVSGLKTLLETGEELPEVPDDRADLPQPEPSVQLHREQGIDTNQETWAFLGKDDRSQADDERMVHTAHASAYHWGIAGDAANHARGEWLCSHVYAVVSRAEPALHHARRCLAITEEHGLVDFDLAYAHEAMARALALAGQLDEARHHLATAKAVPIAGAEDREIVEADIAAEPWYSLTT
jgi:uncharacterized protein YndB with AHSA1/START domain